MAVNWAQHDSAAKYQERFRQMEAPAVAPEPPPPLPPPPPSPPPPPPVPDPSSRSATEIDRQRVGIEDRMLGMAEDPQTARNIEKLIDPETGSTYSDREQSLMMRNALARGTQIQQRMAFEQDVRDADRIVASARRHDDPIAAYAVLQELSATPLRPELAERVLEHPETRALLDETVRSVRQVGDETGPRLGASPALEVQLEALGRALPSDVNPVLSGALFDRVLPVLGTTVDGRYPQGMVDHVGAVERRLIEIGERIGGGVDGERRLTELAELANASEAVSALSSYPRLPRDALSATTDSGVDLLARRASLLAEADPEEAQRLLELAVGRVERYAAGEVSSANDAYAEHTEELRQYVSSYRDILSPEQLYAAVEDYTAGQTPEWRRTEATLREARADTGVRLLAQLEALANPALELDAIGEGLDPGFEERMAKLGADPAVNGAVSLVLQERPDEIAQLDVPAVADLFKAPKYFNDGRNLGTKLTQVWTVSTVLPALRDVPADGPVDATKIQAARDALQAIDDKKFLFIDVTDSTKVAALDDTLLELERLVDLRSDGVPQAELLEAQRKFGDKVDALDLTPDTTNLFKAVGYIASGIGFAQSLLTASSDPSLKNTLAVLPAGMGLATGTVDLLTDVTPLAKGGLFHGNLGTGSPFAKVGSTGGAILGGVGVVADVRDGRPVRATVGAIGTAGSLAAVYGGPAGAAYGGGVSVLAGVVTVGIDVHHALEQMDLYTGEEAAEFLAAAGIEPDAVALLTDRSREGYNAVPAFAEYAAARGLSREETVEWINAMDSWQLERTQQLFFEVLNAADGDLSTLEGKLFAGAELLEAPVSDWWDLASDAGIDRPESLMASLAASEMSARVAAARAEDSPDAAARAELARLETGLALYQRYATLSSTTFFSIVNPRAGDLGRAGELLGLPNEIDAWRTSP